MARLWRLIILALSFLTHESMSGRAEAQKQVEPPIVFAVVRYSSYQCEPVCPQWILAEGQITASSSAQLKKFIKANEKLKLPILIQSGGGDVRAALQMGRMIRKAGLDVVVGWTLLRDDCKPGMKTCKLPPEQNNVYSGFPFSGRAYCNSACNLVLAGGVNRSASASVFVGAHQILTNWTKGDTIYYRDKYRIVNNKKQIISHKIVKRVKGKSYTTNGLYKGLRKELTAYLNEMGVGLGYFELMDKAPPTSIYQVQEGDLKKIKLTTSQQGGEEFFNPQICKGYPLVGYCIFRLPLSSKS